VWLFESFFFFFARTATHVRPRTYGHARAKERPVWLLFVACSLKVFFVCFFFFNVRPRTYGHALVYLKHKVNKSDWNSHVKIVTTTIQDSSTKIPSRSSASSRPRSSVISPETKNKWFTRTCKNLNKVKHFQKAVFKIWRTNLMAGHVQGLLNWAKTEQTYLATKSNTDLRQLRRLIWRWISFLTMTIIHNCLWGQLGKVVGPNLWRTSWSGLTFCREWFKQESAIRSKCGDNSPTLHESYRGIFHVKQLMLADGTSSLTSIWGREHFVEKRPACGQFI